MKISEFFGGDEQDGKIETIEKLMKFRKVFYDYAQQSGSEEAMKLATMVAHALLGAAHGYKACCVLFFVECTFRGEIPPKTLHPTDSRSCCPKCQKEVFEWIVDTNLR